MRTLVVPYFSNLVGSLLLVGLQYGSQAFHGKLAEGFLIALAEKKCHLGWGVVVVRGERGSGGRAGGAGEPGRGGASCTGFFTSSCAALVVGTAHMGSVGGGACMAHGTSFERSPRALRVLCCCWLQASWPTTSSAWLSGWPAQRGTSPARWGGGWEAACTPQQPGKGPLEQGVHVY